MQVSTVDEVIQYLDVIIADQKERCSPLGFFPALYRQVTVKVKQGIEDGSFEDGPRMERLDVTFANRYFAAFDAFEDGERPSRSWQIALDAASQGKSMILQYLILGINAHINLDLAIAAAQVAPGDQLPDLKKDFFKINEILSQLLDPAQGVINKFSPLLGLLDLVGGRTDEAIANFSINKARDVAWEHAEILAEQTPAQQTKTINALDRQVAWFGRFLADPGGLLGKAICIIRFTESKNVPAIIDALGSIS